MSKLLVVLGIAILVVGVSLITAAYFSPDFRADLYASVEGTVLMPLHDGGMTLAQNIVNNGFTFVAATGFGLVILGILTGYVWNHWLSDRAPYIPLLNSKTKSAPTTKDYTPANEPTEPEPVQKKSETIAYE